MISKYSAERVTRQYINDMNDGVSKLWDEFEEMDLQNVGIKQDIENQLRQIEDQVKIAVNYIESIYFEE